MAYSVIKFRRAESDIIEIGRYIAVDLDSPESASKLLDEFEVSISSLDSMPKRFPLVRDDRLAKRGIRLMPVKNYLVFYTIDEQTKTVNIIGVMYGKRDWRNLL